MEPIKSMNFPKSVAFQTNRNKFKHRKERSLKNYKPKNNHENYFNPISLRSTCALQNHKLPPSVRVFYRVLSQILSATYERAHLSIPIHGELQ